MIKNKKVVAVAQITLFPKLMLHETVKFMQIDIGKNLASQITKGYALSRSFFKACNDMLQ